MTKQEHKLVSMLNYYEITIPPKKSKKDEKLNKLELSKFLDNISRNYDLILLEAILEKIRANPSTQNEMGTEQDSYGDMSEEFDDDYFKSEDTSKNEQNIDNPPIKPNKNGITERKTINKISSNMTCFLNVLHNINMYDSLIFLNLLYHTY